MAEELLQMSQQEVDRLSVMERLKNKQLTQAAARTPSSAAYTPSLLGRVGSDDGSAHDWFEGRAPKCCLIVFIDDATSKLLALHFVEAESKSVQTHEPITTH